ncbi:MAG: 50S ribosomal protein L25/general stress protein Ctc [Azoarcus sp.]|jgi:large subunit ribosomal protein L25|nr:50S ribosomal protein L25/general stress protein Ctc [Azoarcus sp.]
MPITFKAKSRELQGSSASRRLRRDGQVPGIVYGGGKDATPIALDHNELFHLLKKEAFHSTLLTAEVDSKKETVIMRDTQWHPYKQQVLHIDFQRIDAKQPIHMRVPLHFINGENCPAVKISGAHISHTMNEIEIKCLPANLPEFITVDLANLEGGHAIHLSQLVLPEGVETAYRGEGDPVVVNALQAQAEPLESEEGEAAAPEGGAAPAA